MLNLPAVLSALVGVAVITAVVVATYYLRPSRGEHANPEGAAVTVASLRVHLDVPVVRPTYDYDDLPTVMFGAVDHLGDLELVRPYLDHCDYRGAAVLALAERTPTEHLPVLARSA